MTNPTPSTPTYDVESAIRVIGGKWKVLIVWHLKDDVLRYGTLRRLMPNITEKMLIQQLRELEADCIVKRTNYQTVPPRVEYTLSDHGRSILPVLGALCEWGRLHVQHEQTMTTSANRASNDV